MGLLSAGAVPGGSATRPWFKKKRFIIPGGLVGLIILGSALNGGGEDPASAAAAVEPSTSVSATTPADTPTSAPAPAPSKAPSPVAKVDTTPKYGSKVRDGKFEFVVTGMKCGIKTVGSEYFNTKAQGEFCRVSMKITNIGDEAQSMFADNQLAFDAKDREFSADSEASIYDDKSNVLFEEINPGNTVSGQGLLRRAEGYEARSHGAARLDVLRRRRGGAQEVGGTVRSRHPGRDRTGAHVSRGRLP